MEWNEWNKWNGMEWNVPVGKSRKSSKSAGIARIPMHISFFYAPKHGMEQMEQMEWNVPFGMCVCKLKTAYRKILFQTEDPP
jgi:hypothetical protein